MKVEERIAAALERIADALEAQNGLLVGGSEPAPCAHPADEREDHSTMGNPRWRCKKVLADGSTCGFSVGM